MTQSKDKGGEKKVELKETNRGGLTLEEAVREKSSSVSYVLYLKCTFSPDSLELKPRKLNSTEDTEIKSQSQ